MIIIKSRQSSTNNIVIPSYIKLYQVFTSWFRRKSIAHESTWWTQENKRIGPLASSTQARFAERASLLIHLGELSRRLATRLSSGVSTTLPIGTRDIYAQNVPINYYSFWKTECVRYTACHNSKDDVIYRHYHQYRITSKIGSIHRSIIKYNLRSGVTIKMKFWDRI